MSNRIALVGDENSTYASHREINAIRSRLEASARCEWVATDGDTITDLSGFDGIWLVPGSPYADDAAVLRSITWARKSDVPFLGTCGGFQYAVVELFRTVMGDVGASHAESDGEHESNVVKALSCSLFGVEREVRPVLGTRFSAMVGDRPFPGMHYCNLVPDPARITELVSAGFEIGAAADDAGVEVPELTANRFFLLSLFQPQIGTIAGKPLHPLIREFVRCAAQRA